MSRSYSLSLCGVVISCVVVAATSTTMKAPSPPTGGGSNTSTTTTTRIASLASAPPNICGTNTTIGNAVLSSLNLTYPGLEAVQTAYQQGDLNTACQALSDYYQYGNTSSWLRIPPVTPGTGLAGGVVDEMVFHDIFYLAGVDITAPVPRNSEGFLNWTYKGPRNDPEFMNCLNRFDSFGFLLNAWKQTGNPIYTTYFDALVKDWVLHVPCPNALAESGTPCVPLGLPGNPCSWELENPVGSQKCMTGTMESPWRSLEMGIRMEGIWPVAFYGFQQAKEFSVDARVLFVLAVAEHNSALLVDGGHPSSGTPNWEMMQWSGLISSVVTFPEAKNTSSLLAKAFQYLDIVFKSGVYPDGVETELASGYDMSTANDFFSVLGILQQGGDAAPPQAYRDEVERMWNYGSYISDPNACLPRNGDSDLCGNGYSQQVTNYFNRTDWTYVHTNGAQGTVPPQHATQGPSSFFPWAGQVAMRSSYSKNASWIWFDIGPYGSSGHAHRDKLNFVLHARSSMLLVDSGRFAYAGTDLSATLHVEYGRNTTAHNTLTFDGCDQLATPAVYTSPIDPLSVVFTPQNDTAFGNMTYYDGLVGNLMHTRGVFYQRATIHDPITDDGDWAVIVDMITTDGGSRSVQATWHTHPNASGISLDPTTHVGIVGGVDAFSGNATQAQVCVIPAPANAPLNAVGWTTTSLVRGQYQNTTTNTRWQGWYSQAYDDAWEATVLMYEGAVNGGGAPSKYAESYFAWLIIPTSMRRNCEGSSVSVISVSPLAVTVSVTVAGVVNGMVVSVPLGL